MDSIKVKDLLKLIKTTQDYLQHETDEMVLSYSIAIQDVQKNLQKS